MKYRDWNEMQRKIEASYVLDNALTDPSEEYLRLIRKTEDGDKFHYRVDNGAGDSLSVIFTKKLVLAKGFAHENALNLFEKEKEEQSLVGSMPDFRRNIKTSFRRRKKGKRLFSFGMMENYIKISLRKGMVGSGC